MCRYTVQEDGARNAATAGGVNLSFAIKIEEQSSGCPQIGSPSHTCIKSIGLSYYAQSWPTTGRGISRYVLPMIVPVILNRVNTVHDYKCLDYTCSIRIVFIIISSVSVGQTI